jgi:autotransporter passenger strand-loop-strand repeat protein
MIGSSGTDFVYGTASGAVVSGSKAEMQVFGTASGVTVVSGGRVYVHSGATIDGATISGIGELELAAGAKTGSSPIVFSSGWLGGDLKLDASVSFGGTISGFTAPDHIDLVDIAFAKKPTLAFVEAGDNLSGTLTVTDGTNTANILLLGHYMASQFTSGTDGFAGTLIGDPPATRNAGLIMLATHHT